MGMLGIDVSPENLVARTVGAALAAGLPRD